MATENRNPGSVADAMREALAPLVTESQELRNDMRTSDEIQRKRNMISMGVMGTIAAAMILMAFMVYQTNQVAQQMRSITETMAECTTPGGPCYEKGNARTATAIGDIIAANIYMAQCARLYPGEVGPEYDAKLNKCVYGRLAEAARKREQATPSPTPSPVPSPSAAGR